MLLLLFILLHEKFLQLDWLRTGVFQLNSKYLHVIMKIRACLHGGGAQVGEVTNGGSPQLSCERDQIKMRDYIWTRELPHLSGLPHLPGVPHLHVNRPLQNLLWVIV